MARSQALRDALRVKRGSRIHLERMDAGATFGDDKESSVAATLQQMERLPASRTGSGPRRSTRSSSCSRASTPRARTGRSTRSWRRSTRRAARSRRSRSRPRRSSATTSCGGSTGARRGKGEIGIFNRSHYEDVLVVRVHDLVPREVWSKRYDQINEFERCSDERHDHRQVLPDHRPRRAAGAVPGALRRPDQALEVQHGRPRGAQALGRLPGGVRRRAEQDVDRERAVVRHPGQSEVVPEPGRGDRSWPTRWPS